MQPRIAVIIPVFNEQANVKKCIRTMLKYTQTISQQIRIIFVNDGSSDNTGLLLKEAAKYNPGKILICTHTKNQGYGAALRTGIQKARAQKCTFCIFMDSDLTNHPRDLKKFVELATDSVDCVKASRYIPGGGMIGVPWMRRVISQAGNCIASLCFHMGIHDYTNGFRMVKTELLSQIPYQENGFAIILEEMYYLYKKGAKCVEIPILLTNREKGQETHFSYTLDTFRRYLTYPVRAVLERLQ